MFYLWVACGNCKQVTWNMIMMMEKSEQENFIVMSYLAVKSKTYFLCFCVCMCRYL
jgi:hypothetical protein